ncbi:hypothetical protein E8E13_006894 [Curvularia kusanoi]|uniref:Nucleoside phosphorylase domain-containing protein n=1 Tax=Curvularia kusanoi TaxID=90978 RepID=A0A9P4W4R7_CURKU|nr:hypothetical protein E8E13_006894 [Curvularia kusanoi]
MEFRIRCKAFPGKDPLSNNEYTVGWICALPNELTAARAFLDNIHSDRPHQRATSDNNTYVLGDIEGHNVVVAVLPVGVYGTVSAASVARDLLRSFENVRIGLMVGIGGGAPSPRNNIHLGDVVVSVPHNGSSGVFQYDFGKTIQDKSFQYTGHLDKPPTILLGAVASLNARFSLDGNGIADDVDDVLKKYPRLRRSHGRPEAASDRLYVSDFTHQDSNNDIMFRQGCDTTCGSLPNTIVDRGASSGWAERYDEPTVFEGIIASADQLMKNALVRDSLSEKHNVLCFEMEAAGLMNNFPCLVVRGICDYSDTHKNSAWQGYAALSAAAYTKQLLGVISQDSVQSEQQINDRLYRTEASSRTVENIQEVAPFKKQSGYVKDSPSFQIINVRDPVTNDARTVETRGNDEQMEQSSSAALSREIQEVLDTIPKDDIWLSDEQNVSLLNRVKAMIEDYTLLEWNWWPLQPRMRALRNLEKRLFWRCSCGVRLWTELSHDQAAGVDHALSDPKDIRTGLPRCRLPVHKYPTNAFGSRDRYIHLADDPSSAQPGQRIQNTGKGKLPVNFSRGSGQDLHQNLAGNSQSSSSSTSTSPMGSWILFGVQGPHRYLQISHIRIDDHTDDSSFYRSLKQTYGATRSWWKFYLSIWTFGYCEIVKFKKLAPRYIISYGKDFPSGVDYIYDPRPPAETPNPPIRRHEFAMRLDACNKPCRLSFFHECMPELNTVSTIACIPKRLTQYEVESGDRQDCFAWGLEAKHEISVARVFIYHVLVLAFPFGFWAWWQTKHPDDLQNASVPATVALALLSLFWGSNGILTEGRHYGNKES